MKLKSFQEEQETDLISSMPNWYYDRRELKETPSITDGIEYDTEQRYRKEGARFIINVGTRMGLRYDTMATGVVYFHRFYMFHSFRTFPRFVTASCCLFLAGKVEETPKKCKDIIKTAQTLLTDQQFAQFGEDPKEEVMTLERILLQTIKFDLQVDHPYGYLLKYAKSLKGDKAKLQKLVQMAWTFINDSLCTTLCLQWEPEIIGIALMYLAGKLSKFEVTDWNGRTSKHNHWWDMFVENMNTEFLEDICHQVLDLYSSPLPTTPQDSPPATPPPPKQNRKSLISSQKNSPTSPVLSTTPPCQPKLKEQISAKTTPVVKTDSSPPAASPLKMPDPTTPGTPIVSTTPKASATPNASATTLPAQIPSLTSITLAVPTVVSESTSVISMVPPESATLPVFAQSVYKWNTSAQPHPTQPVPLENASVYHTGEYAQGREQLVGEPDSKFRKDQIHFTGYETIQASPVPAACIKGHATIPPPQPTYITQVNSAYPPNYVEKHGNISELPYYPPKTPPPDGQYPSFQLPPQYYRTSEAQDQYYSHVHHAPSQQASYRPSPGTMIPGHRSRPASPLPQHLLSKATLPPPPPSVTPSLFQDQYVNRSLHGRSQYHSGGPSSAAIYPPHHAPLPPSLPSHRAGMNHNLPPMGLYRYNEHTPEPPMQHLPFEESSGGMPHGRILGRF